MSRDGAHPRRRDVLIGVTQFHSNTDVRETVDGIRKVAAHFLAKKGIDLGPKAN